MHVALLFAASEIARPTRPTADPFSFLNFTWLIGPIITIVVLAVVFGTVLLPLMRRSAERSRLLESGEQAQAKILGLADTGVKINNNPQLQLQLEVLPEDAPAVSNAVRRNGELPRDPAHPARDDGARALRPAEPGRRSRSRCEARRARVLRTACTRDCPDACQILATVDGRPRRAPPRRPRAPGHARLPLLPHRSLPRAAVLGRAPAPTPLVRRGGALVPATWDEALDLVASKLAEAQGALRAGVDPALHERRLARHAQAGQPPLLRAPRRRSRTSAATSARARARRRRSPTWASRGRARPRRPREQPRRSSSGGRTSPRRACTCSPTSRRARARGVARRPDRSRPQRADARSSATATARRARAATASSRSAVARALFDEGSSIPSAPSYCDGFDAFARARAPPRRRRRGARSPTCPRGRRADLAELLGATRPAAIFVGWGLGRRLHGSATVRLIDALGADQRQPRRRPAAASSYYFPRRGGFDTRFVKRPENAGASHAARAAPRRGDPRAPTRRSAVAVVDNGNPVIQLPDSGTVARALASVDFLGRHRRLPHRHRRARARRPADHHDARGARRRRRLRPRLRAARAARRRSARRACAPTSRSTRRSPRRLGFGERDRARSAEAWIDRLLAPMAARRRDARARSPPAGSASPAAPRVLFEGRRFPTPSGRFQLVDDFPDAPPAARAGLSAPPACRTRPTGTSRRRCRKERAAGAAGRHGAPRRGARASPTASSRRSRPRSAR